MKISSSLYLLGHFMSMSARHELPRRCISPVSDDLLGKFEVLRLGGHEGHLALGPVHVADVEAEGVRVGERVEVDGLSLTRAPATRTVCAEAVASAKVA